MVLRRGRLRRGRLRRGALAGVLAFGGLPAWLAGAQDGPGLPGLDLGMGRAVGRAEAGPGPDAAIRDLEVALHRLDYYEGAIDGLDTDGFRRAVLAFERDEGLPADPAPGPGLLDRADAAIGRIPPAGDCPEARLPPAGRSVACGRVR